MRGCSGCNHDTSFVTDIGDNCSLYSRTDECTDIHARAAEKNNVINSFMDLDIYSRLQEILYFLLYSSGTQTGGQALHNRGIHFCLFNPTLFTVLTNLTLFSKTSKFNSRPSKQENNGHAPLSTGKQLPVCVCRNIALLHSDWSAIAVGHVVPKSPTRQTVRTFNALFHQTCS